MNLDEFEKWWRSRRHRRKKIKGLSYSEQTLKCYKSILSRMPDIKINEHTDPDAVVSSIRDWLNNNVGKGKMFKKKYPQLIFAIRAYLRMYEDDPNPKINRIAKNIRTMLQAPVYQDVKGTQKLFLSKVLTKQQIRSLIKYLNEIKLPHGIEVEKATLMFQLLYDTGCRIGELSNIKKKDIDFENREILVVGKGKYTRRVGFESSTAKLLMKFCTMKDEDKVFGWSTQTMKVYFRKIIKLVQRKKILRGLKVTPHWFRHTRATHLDVVWKDVVKLKDYMGWSDIKMAEVYLENRTLLSPKIRKYKSTDLWED